MIKLNIRTVKNLAQVWNYFAVNFFSIQHMGPMCKILNAQKSVTHRENPYEVALIFSLTLMYSSTRPPGKMPKSFGPSFLSERRVNMTDSVTTCSKADSPLTCPWNLRSTERGTVWSLTAMGAARDIWYNQLLSPPLKQSKIVHKSRGFSVYKYLVSDKILLKKLEKMQGSFELEWRTSDRCISIWYWR